VAGLIQTQDANSTVGGLFLWPWKVPAASTGADAELRREIGPQHVLYGRSFRASGVTVESDDWLFELDDGTFAQVHLTYTPTPPEPLAAFPSTRIFATLADWMLERMLPDHVDHLGLWDDD
jgi:hypothetical protein